MPGEMDPVLRTAWWSTWSRRKFRGIWDVGGQLGRARTVTLCKWLMRMPNRPSRNCKHSPPPPNHPGPSPYSPFAYAPHATLSQYSLFFITTLHHRLATTTESLLAAPRPHNTPFRPPRLAGRPSKQVEAAPNTQNGVGYVARPRHAQAALRSLYSKSCQ